MRAKRSFQTYLLRCLQIGLMAITACLLSGCNYPSPKEDLPTCLPGEITTPAAPLGPRDSEVIDTLSPTFIWLWDAECNPQEFLVEVFNPTTELPAMTSGRVAGTFRGWDMPGELQSGSTYSWRVTPYTDSSAGAVSHEHIFMTGPDCPGPDAADYPVPTLLAPPDGTVITEMSPIHVSDGSEWPSVSIRMVWDDSSLCNPEGYQMQVSTSPSFPDGQTLNFPVSGMTSVPFFFPPGVESFPMRDCTLYYWHVRAVLSDDEFGPWSEIWTFFIHTSGLLCDTIPIISPEPPPVPVPVIPPLANATQNANCRSGPSQVFSIESTLLKGQSAKILGRTEESTWWLIEDPAGGDPCWVWEGSVEPSGDLTAVQVVASPPTPEVPAPRQPEQRDGQEEDGQDGGQATGCWLIDNQHPNGYCAARPCGPNDYPGSSCNP